MEQRNSNRKGPEVDACLSLGRRPVRLNGVSKGESS